MRRRGRGWARFLLLLADAMLGGAGGVRADDGDRPPATVHDIRSARPQLRRVVDQVGDEVEREVFPGGRDWVA